MSVSIGVTLEPDVWITCHDYSAKGGAPILSAYSGGQSLMVYTAHDAPAQVQIEVARRYADAAARFLALTETWAAANTVSLIKAA
jgi:hypothetical protein